MSLQSHYLSKFPALYIINRLGACAHRVALTVLCGGQAASAESCTHPVKRDYLFSPPIAERQRLPFAKCPNSLNEGLDLPNFLSHIMLRILKKSVLVNTLWATLYQHFDKYLPYWLKLNSLEKVSVLIRLNAKVVVRKTVHFTLWEYNPLFVIHKHCFEC